MPRLDAPRPAGDGPRRRRSRSRSTSGRVGDTVEERRSVRRRLRRDDGDAHGRPSDRRAGSNRLGLEAHGSGPLRDGACDGASVHRQAAGRARAPPGASRRAPESAPPRPRGSRRCGRSARSNRSEQREKRSGSGRRAPVRQLEPGSDEPRKLAPCSPSAGATAADLAQCDTPLKRALEIAAPPRRLSGMETSAERAARRGCHRRPPRAVATTGRSPRSRGTPGRSEDRGRSSSSRSTSTVGWKNGAPNSVCHRTAAAPVGGSCTRPEPPELVDLDHAGPDDREIGRLPTRAELRARAGAGASRRRRRGGRPSDREPGRARG